MFEPSRSLRILLVDVDLERAVSTAHRLVSNGHDPARVDQPAQAIELGAKRMFDVALIEVSHFDAAMSDSVRELSQALPALPLMGVISRAEPLDGADIALFTAYLLSPLHVATFEKAFAFVHRLRSAQTLATTPHRPRYREFGSSHLSFRH